MSFSDILATPADTDWAWKAVTTILPTGSDGTAFSAVMYVLSTSLVALATAWLAYSILMLVVRAARKGEPLSDQQSGAMAMIRVVIGLGCLVPVADGLSVVHFVLRDAIARPGINIANAASNAAVEFILTDGHSVSPVSAGGRDLVISVVESEVCAKAYAVARDWQVIKGDGGASLPPPVGSEIVAPAEEGWFPWSPDTPARVVGYSWSWGPACGSLSLSRAEGFAKGQFGDARRQAVAAVVAEVRGMPFADQLADAVKIASANGRKTLTGPDVEAVYASRGMLKAAVDATLRQAGIRYDRALSDVAASLASGQDTGLRELVVRDVAERGFVALGGYYRILAHASLASSEAVAEQPSRSKPDPREWESVAGPVGTALALVESQLRKESAASALASGDELTAEAAEGGNFLAALVGRVTGPVNDYFTGYSGWRVDPIGDLMTLGTTLMVSAQAAFALALAAYGGSAIFGGAGGDVLNMVMTAGWPLIGMAWVGGALLAYVLPMIPFAFMLFAVAAWIYEVVKAAIAASVWAFLHANVKDEELIGQAQRQGYISMVVGVLLRPVITVATFVAMHAVNVVVLNMVLASYNIAFKSAVVGYSLGATGLVVSIGMLLFMQWQLVLWSYRLLTSMPQKVAEFIGFQASAWGDDDAGSAVVGAATMGHRHVPRLAPGAVDKGGDGGDGTSKSAKAGAKALGASAGGPAGAAAATKLVS
ncbi:DotA/TraY family protein [Aurantimonas sp. Leaf443]|uniref:DotA/TraY family protein n=1 Tax=Aurantimonas sp. Leaf443 TaxID=1736378 RepID=UPI0006F6D74C|nr:DotA/TraY family protein [Aurantimonas sp. Leaf443]KQT83122.1 hypothetical protein ASG48_14210 [Aurantimonas sp. Leaf443]